MPLIKNAVPVWKGTQRQLRGNRLPGLLLLFMVAAVFCFSGCDSLIELQDTDTDETPHSGFILPDPAQLSPEAGDVRLGYLYYADTQYRFLVPVRRAIPWVEGIAATTLLYLSPSPESADTLQTLGLSPTLPARSAVNGMAINEGVARVDFNSAFLSYPPEHERLVLGSILCTLRQFSTIETVEILVGGEKVERFPGGAPGRLPLGPECYINLELDETIEDYRDYTAIRLYFCYSTPNGRVLYVPVTRILPAGENTQQAVMRELLEGPRKGSGLYSELPTGTELIRFSVEEGLAVLDFSESLLTYQGGRTGAENIANQILLTLSELEEIEQVQILVEGVKVTLEGLDLANPLVPLEVYNYF